MIDGTSGMRSASRLDGATSRSTATEKLGRCSEREKKTRQMFRQSAINTLVKQEFQTASVTASFRAALKKCDDLLARDGRKAFQKVVDGIAASMSIEKRLKRERACRGTLAFRP